MSLQTYAWLTLLFPLGGMAVIAATALVLPVRLQGVIGTLAIFLAFLAAVGAVILARRCAGLSDAREISVADVMRGEISATDAAPETMLEAGGPPQR